MEEAMTNTQMILQQQVETQLSGMQASIGGMQTVIEQLSTHVMRTTNTAPEQASASGAFGPEPSHMPGGT